MQIKAKGVVCTRIGGLAKHGMALALSVGWLIFALPVQAAFTGDYALTNFQLLNINSDGTWATPDGDQTLVITGGNNGSGLWGGTYFLMYAPVSSVISFEYSWATEDEFVDWDRGGYFLNGKFWALSPDAVQGTKSFSVAAGDGFGFAVETDDNQGGSGILTVSQFEAAAVPEPVTTVPILLVAAGSVIRRIYRARNRVPRVAV